MRDQIIRRAQQIWEMSPIFLDTETTGLGARAEIVEICILDTTSQPLFHSLVRPRSPIPADAERLHGISNSQVASAPTWLQVWPQVEALLRNRYVGIYNVEFDLKMMQQSHRVNSMLWRAPEAYFFDIMKMYADYAGHFKWQKLEVVARECGILPPQVHRACQDTWLARSVFCCIFARNQVEK